MAKILLAEDDDSLRGFLVNALKRAGHVVKDFDEGRTALKALEREVFDLLLTDIVMPEMNGREVARRVRELRPKVKVLYMSGYTGDVLLQHGELEDDASMIAKPFSRDALASKVREALG